MADEADISSEREQHARDIALANTRAAAAIDLAPRVCAGCDVSPQGRVCGDYKECLADFERRLSAEKRNGRG